MREFFSFSNRKDRLVPWALLALGCALLAPLVLSPKAGIAVVGAGLLVWSASRSVAWPLGLAGFAAPVVALAGHDPFPHRSEPLILFAWICAAIVFELGRGRATGTLRAALASPLFLATGALLALLLIRLPASTDPAYGNFKFELFVLGILPLLVAGVLLGRRPRDVEVFLVLALILDALSGLLVLRQLGTPVYSNDRFGLPGQGVISLGIQGGEGLMIAVYLLLTATRARYQMLAAALLPVTAIALVASGSRGPVLGGLLGLVTLLVLLARSRRSALRVAAVCAALAVAWMAISALVPSAATQRSLSIISGGRSGMAANGRDQLWAAAWHTFRAHPLVGIGTGSFATADRVEVCPGPGCEDRYPHNAVLETAAELGLPGALAFLAVVAAGAVALVRAWRAPAGPRRTQVAIVSALFVAALTTAMVTGDLSGDGDVWLAAGIGLGLTLGQRRASS
jgi:O-antigen ligase